MLVNREAPEPVTDLLGNTFTGQSVTVTEESVPDLPSDTVALVENGTVVARSPLEELRTTVLFVNSDIYSTGQRELGELDLPDVLVELADTPFRLRGFPMSDTQKLLLVTLSRYVEQLAFEGRSGTLRAAFQRLSRLEDEHGTKRVYRTLAGTDLDVHVYGVPDTVPTGLDVHVHRGRSREYRKTWVVSYRPATDGGRHAALVAYERSREVWDGCWTFDADRVRDIDEYMTAEL